MRAAEMRVAQGNTGTYYQIRREDLPLHCPVNDASLWSSHPRVYLPIEKTGEARCPYCSALYRLVD